MSELPPIPKIITLYGIPIKIIFSQTLFADRGRPGEFCIREVTITLDSNFCLAKQWTSLCHEIVEAILDLNLIDLEDESEKQMFALGLFQLFSQNIFPVKDDSP